MDNIEMIPVEFITIGTIGGPGQRTFHLQAADDSQLVTLTLEKEQASAIAESINNLLSEIEEQYSILTEVDSRSDLELREPILSAFRIGQIGLGYDDTNDQIIIIMNELLPDDVEAEPRIARFGTSRHSMKQLAEHTVEVVAQGRARSEHNGHKMHY